MTALRTLVLALACALVATVTFASPAGKEEAPAAAMEKEMVTDPTTGEMVVAPEYGGTLTAGYKGMLNSWDHYSGWPDPPVMGVLEKLAIANWGIDRDVWDLKAANTYPPFAVTGRLAESWETPDDTTLSSTSATAFAGTTRRR